MKSFTLEKYGITRGGQIMCNVIIMRKQLFNIIGRIRLAPSRFTLKEFGGHLTIEEFRDGETVDTGTPFVDQETFPVENKFEFVKRAPIASTKLADISHSHGTNEPLRLKRTKPLKRDENNLEKTLGITRKKAPFHTHS